MTGKLVPSGVHLLDHGFPGRCRVDGTLSVINTGDEESGFGAIGGKEVEHVTGVLVRAIVVGKCDLADSVTGVNTLWSRNKYQYMTSIEYSKIIY